MTHEEVNELIIATHPMRRPVARCYRDTLSVIVRGHPVYFVTPKSFPFQVWFVKWKVASPKRRNETIMAVALELLFGVYCPNHHGPYELGPRKGKILNFFEVSGDIVDRVDTVFFSDPMKALGMK
jgi:hypothetical protein